MRIWRETVALSRRWNPAWLVRVVGSVSVSSRTEGTVKLLKCLIGDDLRMSSMYEGFRFHPRSSQIRRSQQFDSAIADGEPQPGKSGGSLVQKQPGFYSIHRTRSSAPIGEQAASPDTAH